ncbi:hypothetical protein [Rhizobium binxianense]|uniref:hypothetical protein n=1 Tax=Rhizobium binxianense TaxID=3024242 RepID=UPI00235FDFE3|nr:hypothetical protein [Rhizobium sp. MC62]MDC9808805.1 hypothetical protein [Rhizobium sp. MC62]
MTPSVTIHMINDEPRILDIELGAWLGYGRAVKIRDVIKGKSEELARYGVLSTVLKAAGPKDRGPTEEFYLNEGQAIRLATLADAIETPEVCEMIIKAFISYRRSQSPAPASTPDLAPVISQLADTLAYLTKLMAPR